MQIAIIGGGAAGFFAAITCAEALPQARVRIYEAGREVLSKVRISGGGRCNVTTGLDDLAVLQRHYPRGARELRGIFRRFGPGQTRAWFGDRGVALKTESDDRVFPVSNSSASIVACLCDAAAAAGVQWHLQSAVRGIERGAEGFHLATASGSQQAAKVLLACGGGARGHALAAALGHSIVPPVPSLFTFTVRLDWLRALAGVSVPHARLHLLGLAQEVVTEGPLLITHWGLSGPAVLKASAWGARLLHAVSYAAALRVNWLGTDDLTGWLTLQRRQYPKRQVHGLAPEAIPRRLWQVLCERAGVPENRIFAELTRAEGRQLCQQCCDCQLPLQGKGVFKEEFVTAGGIARDEIDWRSMQSRLCPGLYFAGEIIDIDALTGGFNFQAAWSTGYLAGRSMASGT